MTPLDHLNALRPYLDEGLSYITRGDTRLDSPIQPALLTQANWRLLDKLLAEHFAKCSPGTQELLASQCYWRFDDVMQVKLLRALDGKPSFYRARPLPPINQCTVQLVERPSFDQLLIIMKLAVEKVAQRIEKSLLRHLAGSAHSFKAKNDRDHEAKLALEAAGFHGPFKTFHFWGRGAIVQMTPNVIRLIIGLDPITVQVAHNVIKFAACMTPEIRCPFANAKTGIALFYPPDFVEENPKAWSLPEGR